MFVTCRLITSDFSFFGRMYFPGITKMEIKDLRKELKL